MESAAIKLTLYLVLSRGQDLLEIINLVELQDYSALSDFIFNICMSGQLARESSIHRKFQKKSHYKVCKEKSREFFF